jgi:hypothetical protein
MVVSFVFGYLLVSTAWSADLFREQSGVTSAVSRYKVSGKGVIIAILDRGIEWQNPDFINQDGTTRIKWLLDMSGQTWCDPGNRQVEYSAAQINEALRTGRGVNSRDAVGHGTVTAGIAAGNGRAYGGGIHLGVAPEADLIIVKLTSEGAPIHDKELAEAEFHGCTSQALDWIDKKIGGDPAVGLINSGVQLWGPIDGTSIVSRKIDAVFGTRPGRIFVAPSGDEGGRQNHAGGTYSNQPTIVKLTRSREDQTDLAMWFKGPPLSIDLAFDDDQRPVRARTNNPGEYVGNGISMWVYGRHKGFYPVTDEGDQFPNGDQFVVVRLTGHATTGRIILQDDGPVHTRPRPQPGRAQPKPLAIKRFDLYSDVDPVTSFSDHLVPGWMTDLASTKSAIVVGAHVSTNTWVDIDGTPWVLDDDVPGRLWKGSAGGPTRAGNKGVDVAAPGGNVFGTYAGNSYWQTLRSRLVQDGGGFYGWQSATSGAAPIVVGAIALMLQMKPDLTSDQVRTLLRSTAISDSDTGPVPNADWGYGKINVRAALDRLCAEFSACGPAR